MTVSSTLSSLAILKVNIDQGRDYLEYLKPFILQVLNEYAFDSITDQVIKHRILEIFGLDIPERTVQVVLRRITREGFLQRTSGKYRIVRAIPNPGIITKKTEAERHISAVIHGLIEFSSNSSKAIPSYSEAESAIYKFLAEFDISCLQAYLRGTVIPNNADNRNTDIILVSEYVIHLQKFNPERFDSFMIMVQGNMLANALLCPDLEHITNNYKQVSFYLDTPVVIQRLGLEGRPKENSVRELLDLLVSLRGKLCIFSHSRDELQRVIRGASNYLESPNARGEIVMHARRSGTTKSDLLLIAEGIDHRLADLGIILRHTPQYIEQFQIDEELLEQEIEDELDYFNPRAREDDINSVRSIFVLREGVSPPSLEKSEAVLVTSNVAFARAAYHYGRNYEETREVSSVIDDITLSNISWLKAPMGAPDLPASETIAFAYAALRPSKKLLNAYLTEINRLSENGEISPRDLQLLRSSPTVMTHVVSLTLGDEDALTSETVIESLQLITEEILKEESQKLGDEKREHDLTHRQLDSIQEQLESASNELLEQKRSNKQIIKRLYWRSQRRAIYLAWIPSSILSLLLLFGLLEGLGLLSLTNIPRPVILLGSIGVVALTILNLTLGTTVRQIHSKFEHSCLTWLLKRESKALGINIDDIFDG